MGTTNEVLQFLIKADGTAAGKTFKDLGSNAEAAGKRAEQSLGSVGSGISGFASQFTSAFSALPPGLKELTVGVGAVGTAVAGFAVKSVLDFKNLALNVGEFSDATGVSADQASRLIRVATDLNVPLDAVQSSIGKLAKAQQGGILDNLGVQTAHFKNGAVDLNGTLLNVVDHLNSIPDAAQRDAEAAKIFGKGWQNIAPIITEPVTQLKEQLDSVNKSAIVSDTQVAQARTFRDAMNSLQNSFQAVGQTLGATLLPFFAQLAQDASAVVSPLQQLSGGGTNLTKVVGGLATVAASSIPIIGPGLGGAVSFLTDQVNNSADATDKAAKKQQALKDEIQNLKQGFDSGGHSAAGFVGDMTDVERQAAVTAGAQKDLADSTAATAAAQQQQADSLKAVSDGAKLAAEWVKALNDAELAQFDATKSLLQLQTDLPGEYRDVAAAAKDAEKAAADAAKAHGRNAALNAAAADAAQKLGDKLLSTGNDYQKMAEQAAATRGATLNATQDTVEYAKGLLTAAGSSKTAQAAALAYLGTLQDISKPVVARVTALVNEGNLPGALALLSRFEGQHTAYMQVIVTGDVTTFRSIAAQVGGGLSITAHKAFAAGGNPPVGVPSLVGERGPEIFVPKVAGTILPHGVGLGSLGGGGVSINIGTVVANDPAGLVTALERYVQQAGKGRLQKLVGV